MAQKSIEERLSQLDSQRKALQARLIKQERAKDTRRKILLGALVLEKIDNGHEADKPLLAWLRTTLPGYLKRPDDKALFDDLLKSTPNGAVSSASSPALNGSGSPGTGGAGQTDLLAGREAGT
ncbi:MAG: mobilization protein [Acidocella sp.]|nr:mobilization protein [Acidocella sp.]